MSQKPYSSYEAVVDATSGDVGPSLVLDRMSDFCGGCRFDRKARTGEDACPFTTLYWDFLARHADRFAKDRRMARQVAAARKLSDLPEVQARAHEVIERLERGAL